jgi:hypothetical protein
MHKFQDVGVCAKPLKAGDVAWKCEDCEKDPTCIICNDCFKKGDHTGHRVWLKTSVSGCCDCGDPDAWEEKGFCKDHKGFAASVDQILEGLPPYIKESAPLCFQELASNFKTILLAHQKDKKYSTVKVTMIVDYLQKSCQDLPSNIYFVSEALTSFYVGKHKRPAGHVCTFRYFISEAEQALYESQAAMIEDFDTFCTCSPIDLLLQGSTKL